MCPGACVSSNPFGIPAAVRNTEQHKEESQIENKGEIQMAIQKKSVTRGLTAMTKGKARNRVAKKAKTAKIGPGTSLLTAYKSSIKF